jgi:hypothetical protein
MPQQDYKPHMPQKLLANVFRTAEAETTEPKPSTPEETPEKLKEKKKKKHSSWGHTGNSYLNTPFSRADNRR